MWSARPSLAVLAVLAACAAGVVDEPPTPDEPAPTEPPPPAPAPSASEAPEEAPAHERCARPPALVEVDLPDGGTAVVVLLEECREVPERDLGDPPPG